MENVNLDGIRIAYTRAGSGRSAEGPGASVVCQDRAYWTRV